MIWIRINHRTWLRSGQKRDKYLISCYLWRAKWGSSSSTCPSCQPVTAPINQAQTCLWQESSSRTTSPLSSAPGPQTWGLRNPHGTIIPPFPPHSTNSGRLVSASIFWHPFLYSCSDWMQICDIKSLHRETPSLHPCCNMEDLLSQYECFGVFVVFFYVCVCFCFKPAITTNCSVQEVSDMKLWCIWRHYIKYVCCCFMTVHVHRSRFLC